MKTVQRRNSRGLGIVELAASAFALLIMVLLCVNIGALLIGNQTLDRAARDAARAAASQNNKDDAIKAAKGALKMHKTDGTFITQPKLTSEASPDFVYQDYGGTPFGQAIPGGGGTAGNATVTVTSQVDVMLPASFGVLGAHTNQDAWASGKMNFKRTYTFPIVKQSLNSSFGGTGP